MYIHKNAKCKIAQSISKSTKKERSKNIKEALITKKERAKEQRERITKCESPSHRKIKKGTRKESKQLVIGSFQVLKSPPIAFPPNTPHQTQQN